MSHPMTTEPCPECKHPWASHGWLSGVCFKCWQDCVYNPGEPYRTTGVTPDREREVEVRIGSGKPRPTVLFGSRTW